MTRPTLALLAAVAALAGAAAIFATLAVQSQLRASFPYPYLATANEGDPARLRTRLSVEPLQARALRDLALLQPERQKLLALSQRVSRRDPVTQLLLLDRSAEAGHLRATLNHYDTLLAIAPNLRTSLIDALATAATRPDVFVALEAYAERPWLPGVIEGAAKKAINGADFLGLVKAHPFARPALQDADRTGRILRALLGKPDPEAAFGLVAFLPPPGLALDEFGFRFGTLDPTLVPLAWQLHETSTLLPPDTAGNHALGLSVPPNARTRIAARYTNFQPGAYRLAGAVRLQDAPKLQLHWLARCENGAKILDHRVPGSQADGPVDLAITIPAGCAVQRWEISVIGDDASKPSRLRIELTGLRPDVDDAEPAAPPNSPPPEEEPSLFPAFAGKEPHLLPDWIRRPARPHSAYPSEKTPHRATS